MTAAPQVLPLSLEQEQTIFQAQGAITTFLTHPHTTPSHLLPIPLHAEQTSTTGEAHCVLGAWAEYSAESRLDSAEGKNHKIAVCSSLVWGSSMLSLSPDYADDPLDAIILAEA